MKEIECKILGMDIEELLVAGEEFLTEVQQTRRIIDEYWEMPEGSTIRFRREIIQDGDRMGEMDLDLTIKGAEENDGKHTSEREEIVLPLESCFRRKKAETSDVMLFMGRLGGKLIRRVEKDRAIIVCDQPVRIHHDALRSGGVSAEWVEVEADSLEELHDFLFKLGVEEFRDRISNLTTLDIIN
jgi:hypothetical protein